MANGGKCDLICQIVWGPEAPYLLRSCALQTLQSVYSGEASFGWRSHSLPWGLKGGEPFLDGKQGWIIREWGDFFDLVAR